MSARDLAVDRVRRALWLGAATIELLMAALSVAMTVSDGPTPGDVLLLALWVAALLYWSAGCWRRARR